MITERQRKTFRIAKKLCDISHRSPNGRDAAFFLRNVLRYERVMRGISPFQNLSSGVEVETRAEKAKTARTDQDSAQTNGEVSVLAKSVICQRSGSTAPPTQNTLGSGGGNNGQPKGVPLPSNSISLPPEAATIKQ